MWRAFLLIAAISLAAHAAFLLQDRHNPTRWHPIVDAEEYDDMARQIASGQYDPREPYWHPPLYPYFLALVYAASDESIRTAKIVQSAVGVVTCLLAWVLGRRLYGDTVGLLAGVMLAVWGPLIFFNTQLLATGLSVLLNLLAVLVLVRVTDRPAWYRWALCGGAIGLAALALPNILLLLIALLAWLAAGAIRARSGRMIAHAVILVSAAAAVVAPATLHNWRACGEFVPISVNGGINFYIGNNPASFRTIGIRPGREWEQLRREPEVQGVTTARGADAYFYRESFDYIKAQPGDFLKGLLRRVRLFVNAREVPRNVDVYTFRGYSSVLRALTWRWGPVGCPFGLVAPLAAVGAIAACRANRRGMWLVLYAAVYGASVILFFVSSRHRLPVVPVVAIFASYGIVWFARTVRARRFVPAGGGVVLTLVAGLAINCRVAAPADGVNFEAEMHRFLGLRAIKLDKLEIAEDQLRTAVALDPGSADAHVSLGDFLLAQAKTDEAARHLQRAIAIDPTYPQAHHSLGRIAETRGRWADAAHHFREALVVLPVRHDSRYKLAVSLINQGKLAEAVEQLEEGLRRGASGGNYRRSLALLLFQLGRYPGAEARCRASLEAEPQDAEMQRLLGNSIAAQERWPEAVEHLRRAVEMVPANAPFKLELARTLHAAGRTDEAIEVAQRALETARKWNNPDLIANCERQIELYQNARAKE